MSQFLLHLSRDCLDKGRRSVFVDPTTRTHLVQLDLAAVGAFLRAGHLVWRLALRVRACFAAGRDGVRAVQVRVTALCTCVQETFLCELPLRLSRACLGKSCIVSRTLPTLATRGKKTEEEARGVFLVLFFCLVVYISPAVSPVLARNFQASSISPPPAETTRLLFKFSQTTFMLYVCPEPVLANTRLLA